MMVRGPTRAPGGRSPEPRGGARPAPTRAELVHALRVAEARVEIGDLLLELVSRGGLVQIHSFDLDTQTADLDFPETVWCVDLGDRRSFQAKALQTALRRALGKEGLKRCGKCRKRLPLTRFGPSSFPRHRDGKHPYCRKCYNKWRGSGAQRRKAAREEQAILAG